jgi:hypothetical protein
MAAYVSHGGPQPKLSPPPQVAEALNQSVPIRLRSTPRHPSNYSSFRKRQIA